MQNKFLVSALACAALSLLSCQSAGPAARIEKNPVLFQSLPLKQQELVKQGRIAEGMGPDAVFLAWGQPNTPPYRGEKNGKRVERWVYTRSTPVTVYNDYAASPYYYGPYRDPFWPSSGFSTAYVPENAANVLFENNKVVSWESR